LKNCCDDDDGWLMDDACSCTRVRMVLGTAVAAATLSVTDDLVHNSDKLSHRLMTDPMSFLLLFDRPNNNKITNHRVKKGVNKLETMSKMRFPALEKSS
jgi:hypothetical protein